MNTSLFISSLIFAILIPLSAYADSARVITIDNAVREDCRFLSPIKVKVRLNDILDVLSKEGDWIRVRFKGSKGCIHKSAVDEKSVDISGVSGTKTTSASRDEVALAGKGFNPEVEKTYRSKHPDLDFQAVDRIEEYKIPDEGLSKFIKSGGLKQP
ncbi:MAG: hypothetical protein HZA17_12770 [Nitrospirae bacterium]|nr:hypothetical protein [Nitrospirota bacterium]